MRGSMNMQISPDSTHLHQLRDPLVDYSFKEKILLNGVDLFISKSRLKTPNIHIDNI